jgi:hypothetical protein
MLASKPITQAAPGTTVVIAGIPGRPLYVKRLCLTASTAATTLQFQDTAGNNLTGVMTFSAGQPFVLPDRGEASSQDGWFEIGAGNGLQIVSVTGSVNGVVQYIQ